MYVKCAHSLRIKQSQSFQNFLHDFFKIFTRFFTRCRVCLQNMYYKNRVFFLSLSDDRTRFCAVRKGHIKWGLSSRETSQRKTHQHTPQSGPLSSPHDLHSGTLVSNVWPGCWTREETLPRQELKILRMFISVSITVKKKNPCWKGGVVDWLVLPT